MNAFDTIVSELMHEENGGVMIDESLRFDAATIQKVPLRYRIIALGFVRKMTLEELNQKLEENGCAKLYARSLWEAGLFYAFLNGLSYEEWSHLQDKCENIRNLPELQGKYFRDSKITVQDLKEYVTENSEGDELSLYTKHLTVMMEKKIAEAASGQGGFEAFLTENIKAFSLVREKTRYYFCKYLYFVLMTGIENYIEAIEAGETPENAANLLTMFKGITPLSRKKMTVPEIREFLNGCAISCGEIFDDFNYFYFEYVDLDWVNVLLEYYGSFTDMPDDDRQRMAAALRRQDPKKYGPLSDDEIIESKQQELESREKEIDSAYSLDGKGKGYQRNRAGENTIRKYIRGTLDIDRTTLICFLLFFGDRADIPDDFRITESRLTEILLSCGFPGLRMNDDFDLFVMGYLDADDPVEFLMQEVTNYALEDENFYLYNVYRNSTSYNEEFKKLTGRE
ncbi:MAG: hypothetical protein IJM62_06610 [Lachnospiraceae bacterium]|nr:hypothetical protein [Lachnospiraceae bacterium]